jgi:hypothetical protein
MPRSVSKARSSAIGDRELSVNELIIAAKKAADSCFYHGVKYASPTATSEQRAAAIRDNAEMQISVDLAILAIKKQTARRKA